MGRLPAHHRAPAGRRGCPAGRADRGLARPARLPRGRPVRHLAAPDRGQRGAAAGGPAPGRAAGRAARAGGGRRRVRPRRWPSGTPSRSALAQLPPEFRSALVLREYADLSYAEIAQAQGVGIQTVKSRLNRARRAVAALLAGPVMAPILLRPRRAVTLLGYARGPGCSRDRRPKLRPTASGVGAGEHPGGVGRPAGRGPCRAPPGPGPTAGRSRRAARRGGSGRAARDPPPQLVVVDHQVELGGDLRGGRAAAVRPASAGPAARRSGAAAGPAPPARSGPAASRPAAASTGRVRASSRSPRSTRSTVSGTQRRTNQRADQLLDPADPGARHQPVVQRRRPARGDLPAPAHRVRPQLGQQPGHGVRDRPRPARRTGAAAAAGPGSSSASAASVRAPASLTCPVRAAAASSAATGVTAVSSVGWSRAIRSASSRAAGSGSRCRPRPVAEHVGAGQHADHPGGGRPALGGGPVGPDELDVVLLLDVGEQEQQRRRVPGRPHRGLTGHPVRTASSESGRCSEPKPGVSIKVRFAQRAGLQPHVDPLDPRRVEAQRLGQRTVERQRVHRPVAQHQLRPGPARRTGTR